MSQRTLFRNLRKSTWYFYHARATLTLLILLTDILRWQENFSKDFIAIDQKRDEKDVQKNMIRYFGVLHHQQGRY